MTAKNGIQNTPQQSRWRCATKAPPSHGRELLQTKERNNYAVFVDLENTGGKVATLNNIIETVKIKGDMLLGRAYGYSERFSYLKEALLSNTFYVVPALCYGHSQKNSMDIQLVIDALETAFKNELIDCFCIVSGDSDYVPLVAKLKSMGKFVLGCARSEVASKVFISACSEFIFLETLTRPVVPLAPAEDPGNTSDSLAALNADIVKILEEQPDPEGGMYASELKGTLMRLRPDFDEKSFGFNTFSKLLQRLKNRFNSLGLKTQHSSLKVYLISNESQHKLIDSQNFGYVFRQQLAEFQSNGFDRVNPSIIKAAVQKEYPEFDERALGFKRFSDLLRALENRGILRIEMTESGTMIIRIV